MVAWLAEVHMEGPSVEVRANFCKLLALAYCCSQLRRRNAQNAFYYLLIAWTLIVQMIFRRRERH